VQEGNIEVQEEGAAQIWVVMTHFNIVQSGLYFRLSLLTTWNWKKKTTIRNI